MAKKNKLEVIVVLDNIRSMHNIGSIFRTCDAIGNCTIYLCGICAIPPNKEIYKTALGAEDSVKWKYFTSTQEAVNSLKQKNFEVIAVEQTKKSVSLNEFRTDSTKLALILGNEVNGISKEIINTSQSCVEINQYGIKKSMNVSVAAGIVLWHIVHKI